MSSLTKEQLQRIEENRRKALERKSANTNHASMMLAATTSVSPKAPFKGVSSSNFYGASVTKPLDVKTVSHGPSAKRFKPDGQNIPKALNGHQNVKNSIQQPAEVKLTANNSGLCKVISGDRFTVTIGYNQQMIEVFKQIPSKLYGTLKLYCKLDSSFINPY